MRYWLNLELGRTHVATTCTCKLKRRRHFKEYEKNLKKYFKGFETNNIVTAAFFIHN